MESTGKSPSKGSILVPIDYSDYSLLACRYAAKIAKKSSADICLFHSYYTPAFDLIEISGGLQTQQQLRADVTDKLIEDEKLRMSSFIKNLYKHKEFLNIEPGSIRSELRAGLAKDEIIAYSKHIQPEMVIMGTRAIDKRNISILGSITESIIRKLSIPVIAIPEGYNFIGEENLKSIVYLTDYDESDFNSIKKLMSFSDLFNMSIHCIHIGQKSDKWEALKMEGLKEYFHKVYHKDLVNCHILEKNTDLLQALDSYVIENDINLIALTHRKRKLLENVFKPSITKKIFYHTNIPLMVFHNYV